VHLGVLDMKKILLAITLLAISTMSYGMCRKSNVCDDYGHNCRVQDICDSNMDLPSLALPPLTPMPSLELKPLPSLALPPLGTSKCEYKQVNGRWQNVCH
jgi:hypothetical protein